jgi:hypothetical protein
VRQSSRHMSQRPEPAARPSQFCRCWKSKTFPLCDNSHLDHNEECGDNAAPVVISGFEPILRQFANNGGVQSTVPPDDPTKRVDMLSMTEIAAKVRADGDVKFCRYARNAVSRNPSCPTRQPSPAALTRLPSREFSVRLQGAGRARTSHSAMIRTTVITTRVRLPARATMLLQSC